MKSIVLIGLFFLGQFAFSGTGNDPFASLQKSKTIGDYFKAIAPNVDAKDMEFLRKVAGKGVNTNLKFTKQGDGSYMFTVGSLSTTFAVKDGDGKWTHLFMVNGKKIQMNDWSSADDLFEQIEKALPHQTSSILDFIFPNAVAQMTSRGVPEGYTPETMAESEHIMGSLIQAAIYDGTEHSHCKDIRHNLDGCLHPNKTFMNNNSLPYTITGADLKLFADIRAKWGDLHSCRRDDEALKKCIKEHTTPTPGLDMNPSGAVPPGAHGG